MSDGRVVARGVLSLPQGWTDADVGTVGAAGHASYSSGTFTVQGSGEDVWGTVDAFNYIYQPLAGDGTIVARVATVSTEANWVKAGVMIRGSLSASSAQAFMLASYAKGVAFQRRVSDDNTSVSTAGSLSTAPRWVKLVRAGNRITGYESADGSSWTLVGTDSFTMGADVLVGLAVSSHIAGTLSTATFDHVAVTATSAGTTNQPPVVSLTAPSSGAIFAAPATISIAAAANDSDGTVTKVSFFANSTLIGTATGTPYAVTWPAVAPGTYSLAAVATDDGGATTTSNPVSITVQAAQGALPPSWENTDVGTTGVQGNSSYSNGTFMIQGAGADVWGSADALQYAYLPMSGDGSITARVATISGQASWVKAGVMIRESLSPSSAQAFILTSVSKGMAFQRRTSDGGISVSTAGSTSTAPRWVKLTRAGDVITAYESSDGSTWTTVGSDSFTMPANVLVGLAVSSHIYGTLATATFDAVATTAMPNKPPTISMTSPANGASFAAPASITMTATASDPENQLTKVEFYNGSTLLGTDTAAPYSFTWSSVAAGTYSLTAVAYDGGGLNTRSNAVSVTVTSGNRPPTISLTSPTSGASFTAPASVTITATASDPQNQLTKVEFYNGATLLGTDTAAPYSLTWSSVAAGTYALTAVAYDAAGLNTRSAAVSVTVTSATLTAPTGVVFTASTDNATVTSYRIDVFAAGANPSTATPVASMNAGKPTPDASNNITVSAPSFFSALAPGNYQLTISAINANGTGRSSPIAFTR
jgi:regulation of enolase protein 1 (concanavalin A-like superfamily)/uncharacterized protein (DUF2141 family)